MSLPIDLIFDGDVRGRYISVAIQNYAKDYGWPGEQLDVDNEFVNEAVDEAIDWLNENKALPGTYWYLDTHFFYGRLPEEK